MLFIMQNYTDNAYGDVPSRKDLISLISFEMKVRTCSFGKKE